MVYSFGNNSWKFIREFFQVSFPPLIFSLYTECFGLSKKTDNSKRFFTGRAGIRDVVQAGFPNSMSNFPT